MDCRRRVSNGGEDYHRHVQMRALVAVLLFGVVLAGCSGSGKAPPTATVPAGGPTLPPIATRVPLTPTPLQGHPLGTRTGIAVIDRVLQAAESGQETALIGVLSYHSYPCGGTPGAPGSTACPAGATPGTSAEVVAASGCDVAYVAKGTSDLGSAVRGLLRGTADTPPLDAHVYAITEVAPARFSSPLPFRYQVIFVSGHSLLLDDAGVTHFGAPCESISAADLFHPTDRVILPPP